MKSPRQLLVRCAGLPVSALAFVAALAFSPTRAWAADPLYVDLDRDGIRDVITIQSVPTNGLRVWLSGSGRSLLLPTRRPIASVAFGDLNGDGHLQLIAADTSAHVHVWHRTGTGGLRPTRPKHGPRPTGVSRSGNVRSAGDDAPGAVIDEGPGAPVDSSHPAGLVPLDASGAAPHAFHQFAAPHNTRPPQPRGPPLG